MSPDPCFEGVVPQIRCLVCDELVDATDDAMAEHRRLHEEQAAEVPAVDGPLADGHEPDVLPAAEPDAGAELEPLEAVDDEDSQ